ncbi:MAG: DUF6111 family protein [Alphaproteobacteria bacterium]|jgi:hypothetical protein
MFRLFFTYILPLIAPALLYVAWNWMQVRRTLSGKRAEPPPTFAEAPWLLLAGAGISILVVTLFGFILFGDTANTNATYVPPHMENGKLVPAETR